MAVTVNGVAPTQAQQKEFASALALSADLPMLGRPVTFGFAGDSIAAMWAKYEGDSPLALALYENYPCNVVRLFSSAQGGSSSSALISSQIGTLEALAVKPDIVVIQSLQNDFMNSTSSADGFFANITQYATRALAAGVKQLWICSRPPKSETAAGVPDAITYINRRIQEFCRSTPGCVYIDVFNACRNLNIAEATTRIDWKSGYSNDGTHPNVNASRAVAPAVAELLKKIAPPLAPLPISLDTYSNSTKPWNSLLGGAGYMFGTSGQLNGVNNTNVAGTAASASARWNITTNNGITATPSIVTGEDGFLYQQIVLSGTASADATVGAELTVAFNFTAGLIRQEMFVETENLTGVRAIDFASTFQAPPTNGLSTNPAANVDLPSGLTTKFRFFSDPYLLNITGSNGNSFRLNISIRNGVTVSGTVRFGRVAAARLTLS